MFDLDKWQEIFATLRTNKLRTFLTMCGVFWGVFMLLVMLGFGNGLSTGVTRSMGGLSANSVYIWGQRTTMPYGGLQPGRSVDFDNADVEAIRRLDGIRYFAPRNQLGGHRGSNLVSRADKSGTYSVMGDYPEIRHMIPMDLTHGRFLDPLDIAERRKVAVIGKTIHQQLFERGARPVGDHIKINGVYFQVIGVFHSVQTGDRADRTDQTIFTPFSTFQQAFNYGDSVGWLAINAEADRSASEMEEVVRATLAARHRIHPEDRQAIGSWNAEEEFGKFQTLFTGIERFIWFVGVCTLLAGVIGVSNIMLIVVKERTREIGVRKALGATPLSIVSMVIQESIFLTALAGYGGVVVGVASLEALAWALDRFGVTTETSMLASPFVDLRVALIAGAILVVSGALAGIIPARHAAAVSPVEALRGE